MTILDVNVLVYAFREDLPEHSAHLRFLEDLLAGGRPFAVPDVVWSGFLRVVTHPRALNPPATLDLALEFAEAVRGADGFRLLAAGSGLWGTFADLCRRARVTGNAVPDALLAAEAIDAGAELITADRGFARFPGLRFRAVGAD